MYAPFAPMTSGTVQFAKDYRAEQIRDAEQSRRAAQCRTRWHPGVRFRRLYDAVITRARQPQPKAPTVQSPRFTAPAP